MKRAIVLLVLVTCVASTSININFNGMIGTEQKCCPGSPPTKTIHSLAHIGSVWINGEGSAEALDFHNDIAYVTSSDRIITVIDITYPEYPVIEKQITLPIGYSPSGVSVSKAGTTEGLVAVSLIPDDLNNRGIVAFGTMDDDAFTTTVEVGYHPDAVFFSPDGSKAVVANEGEPHYFTPTEFVDFPGSITVIDANSLTAIEIGFPTDGVAFAAENPDVIFYNDNPSIDLEPEYLDFSEDGKYAYVVVQESNAIVVVDLENNVVDKFIGLGFKDYSLPENALDTEDRDDEINLHNPPVIGMYQPDTISVFTANGVHYAITANEGDAKCYEDDLTSEEDNCEEVRVKDITLSEAVFGIDNPFADSRLIISKLQGVNNDGEYEELVTFGGRSASIWNLDSGELVWDSKNEVAKAQIKFSPEVFNSNGSPFSFDSRSDAKGGEPEGISVTEWNGVLLAVVGLERSSGLMLYDITNPAAPVFQDYVNVSFDVAPEYVLFVTHSSGRRLLVQANEISGNVSVLELITKEVELDYNVL